MAWQRNNVLVQLFEDRPWVGLISFGSASGYFGYGLIRFRHEYPSIAFPIVGGIVMAGCGCMAVYYAKVIREDRGRSSGPDILWAASEYFWHHLTPKLVQVSKCFRSSSPHRSNQLTK